MADIKIEQGQKEPSEGSENRGRSMNGKVESSRDFMLEEYKHHFADFERSEEIGEHRVNFFITLVTAVFGAFGVLVGKLIFENGDFDITKYYLIINAALLAMLLFGILTLARVIHRNLVSDRELRAMGRIRRYFVEKDPEIYPFLYYKPRDDTPARKKEWKDLASFRTGGLVETVMLINSFIAAILMVLIIYPPAKPYDQWMTAHPWLTAFGLSGIISAWTVQFIYVKFRYDKGRPKKRDIKYPDDFKRRI